MLCKLREINKRTGMVRNMCYDYWPLEVNSPKVIGKYNEDIEENLQQDL